jgi:hypothetical protein
MLDVYHSIDNMHVKKNVCEATCGTLLQQKSKGKDHKNAREDLNELGIRPADEVGSQIPGRLRPGDINLVNYNICHICRSAWSESTDVLSCTPSLVVVMDKVMMKSQSYQQVKIACTSVQKEKRTNQLSSRPVLALPNVERSSDDL